MKQKPKLLSGGLTHRFIRGYTVSMKRNRKPPLEVVEDVINKEKSEGNDKSPYWPKFTLNDNERQGERTSTHYIHCTTSKDKQEKYTVKEDVWESLNAGDTIKLKVDAFGNATIVNKTVTPNESTT